VTQKLTLLYYLAKYINTTQMLHCCFARVQPVTSSFFLPCLYLWNWWS